MYDLLALLAAIFFLLLNAFFVLAEFAIVKVRFTRLEELSRSGNTAAKVAKEVVSQLEAYLSTAQLGITIASLGLGWVGEPALARLIRPFFDNLQIPFAGAASHSVAIVIAFSIITSLHVVFGELVPKNMAIRLPETAALWVAMPFKLFHNIMFVPMWLLNESANAVLHVLRIRPKESEMLHSDEELRMILGQSQEHGKISLGRLMMFEHLFDFGKTLVKEIMTRKESLTCITMDRPWTENLALVKDKKFSRYPLAKTGPDDIFGFIHFKDLALDYLDCAQSCSNPDILKLKRDIHSISEDMTAEKALREFQEKRIQLALTKDTSGNITGLLTMEDIVEELTGEIRDEFDQPPKVPLSSVILKEACSMDLKDVSRFDAIKTILEHLHSITPVFSKEEALKAIIDRENNFSTALGHQTAFPHARLPGLSKPMIAVGKSQEGIYFPSPDNKPVKLIFIILTPFNEPTSQLKILSQLSELISNPTLAKRLFAASTVDSFMDVIRTFENKVLK